MGPGGPKADDQQIKDLEDCKNKLIEKKAQLKKDMEEKAEAEKKEAERQAHEDDKEVLEKADSDVCGIGCGLHA